MLALCFYTTAAFSQDDIVSYTKEGQQMPSISVTTLDKVEIKTADLSSRSQLDLTIL